MKAKILKEFVLLILGVVALWAILVALDLGPDVDDLRLSQKNEDRLGSVLLAEMLGDHPELQSSLLDDAIAKIADVLLSKMPDSEYQYRIVIVENSDVNALTLPGGNIVVFSGLIELVESPEELAAIIAHEIGHTEKHHVVKKVVKALGLEVLVMTVGGGDDLLVGEVLKTAASIVFDRHQEREADQLALDLLLEAKINPRVVASFFRKVQNKSSDLEKKLAILSTHPENHDRIRTALLYRIPPNTQFEPLNIDWAKVKASLGSVATDPSAATE